MTVNTGERGSTHRTGSSNEEILPRWIARHARTTSTRCGRAGARRSNNLFRSLKKADASGLGFREATSARDLRSFHRLYVRTMQKHHSLPRNRRQLAALAARCSERRSRCSSSRTTGRDVAAGAYHVWGDTIELLYNGSDERSARHAAEPLRSTGT